MVLVVCVKDGREHKLWCEVVELVEDKIWQWMEGDCIAVLGVELVMVMVMKCGVTRHGGIFYM